MKFKMTLAAAALAMGFAGQAAAVISLPGSGNGGLFLTAWDASGAGATQGYARDLGITMDAFLASPNVDLSFAADPLFASTFSGVAAANIRWNITAGDRTNPNRLLSTAATDPGTITNAAVNNAVLARMIPMVNDINARTLSPLGSVAVTDPADPEWPGGINWGTNFGSNITTINNAGLINGSVGFYFMPQNGAGQTLPTNIAVQQFFIDGGAQLQANGGPISTWTLNADGSIAFDGTAGIVEPPSNVPLPAAAWLLGSGLLGLAGVARRNNKKAA